MSSPRLTYRARVLAALNASHTWMLAIDVANTTGLTYHQTIFALNALLNMGSIARDGKKSTARWGSLILVEHTPDYSAVKTLEEILYGRTANHS